MRESTKLFPWSHPSKNAGSMDDKLLAEDFCPPSCNGTSGRDGSLDPGPLSYVRIRKNAA